MARDLVLLSAAPRPFPRDAALHVVVSHLFEVQEKVGQLISMSKQKYSLLEGKATTLTDRRRKKRIWQFGVFKRRDWNCQQRITSEAVIETKVSYSADQCSRSPRCYRRRKSKGHGRDQLQGAQSKVVEVKPLEASRD
jgi:hypothetical protein